jgi:hypothetical protein
MAFSTPKPKVHFWVLFGYLCLIFGITGCKPDNESFYPANQSINEPLASDPNRDYRILSVTFAGIPFENIRIDQQKRIITVDIPANFQGGDLKPQFVLTKNTTLLFGFGVPFWSESLCFCHGNRTVSIGPWGTSTNSGGINYTFSFLTTAPLTLKPLIIPLEIPLAETTVVSLSVNNPYANDPVVRAYAQRTDGSTSILLRGQEGYDSGCNWFACDYLKPGTLSFNFSLYYVPTLVPGIYNLFLEQKSGRRITLSQSVHFVRGTSKPDVIAYFGYGIVLGQTSFLMRGDNLFADELTGRLTAQNGQTWSLKPTSSAPNGTTLAMGVPAELKPGYYSFQLLRNNFETGNCLRFSVRQSLSHPQIYSMNGQTTCLAQSPVTLSRSAQQSFIGSFNNNSTLKLVSLADPNRIYSIPIVSPIEGFPRFALPETVLSGSYKATIVAEVNGKSLESEPFEQPVIVQ